jgi:phage terminase large subunit-like protein
VPLFLCEQDRVKYVGIFPKLERPLCTWVQGDKSLDRLDALVWALTELMLEGKPVGLVVF